ncbi:TraR/DksA family transcriptional regulator [Microcella daejeonensis]|uniref:TraR/DksA family transcriptional regulator n=1 Tax=Microcella daejeonensis TaxID=2994971 RepID=A0A9E8MJV0_9MICO|nr:TraR/DksA family transcriptional regulator [Microcella daejeonensis]WAB80402.1 TraR/DksA family transcriptional regulator [Microcella daejeonensis]
MNEERAEHGGAEALARRRAEAAARVERLRAELGAVRTARGENSDDDEHDPEGATISQLWSQSSGLLDAALRELDELDAALARVASGDYGVCRRCGLAIDPARLDARPAAALCIDCARLAG